MNNRLINTKVAGGGGGCTDIVDNYDPFGGGGVALYQLNGNATDVSGNYNGTWGGTEAYTTGAFGQAAQFNGANSYINLGASNSFGISDSISVSVWVKFKENQNRPIISNYPGGNYASGQFYMSRVQSLGYLLVQVYSGSGYQVACNFTFSNDTWYHIVYTKSNVVGSDLFYINGIAQSVFLNDRTFNSGTMLNTSNQLWLANHYSLTDYTNIDLDQVRIFNTALDPLQVEVLYTEELCICDGTVDTLDILGDGSCIATYPLDGNANDLSGNYSGTPTDVSYGVGEFDLAGVFNGSSSKIITARSLPLSNGARTISAWVKTTATTSYNTILMYGRTTVNNQMFAFRMLNGQLGVAGWNADYDVSVPSIYDGNWHNVVATYDGSTLKLYADGQRVGSDYSVTYNTVENPVTIGAYNDGDVPFNGSIDQVRIFNKALNSTEVTTLYNETACTQPTGGTVPDPVSLTDTGVTKTGNMSINVRGFAISDNGRYLALNNYTAGNLEEWDMSTPYNLSTATLSEEYISAGYDILYSPDGNYFYTQNVSFNYELFYYQLTTTNGGWVGNHGSKTAVGYNMVRSNENSLGISYDGEFFWYINNNTKTFYKSLFSTPFDPSTLGGFEAFPLPALLQYVTHLKFTNNGNRIYFVNYDPNNINDESLYVYNLSSPYNLNSTLTYVNNFTNDTFRSKYFAISNNEGKIYTTTKSSAYTIKEFNVNT